MSDDEDYFLPLEDQRVFGAGIKRKRVPFVRSSEHELSTTRPASTPATNIADTYLSIVLKKTAGDVAENLKEDDSSTSRSEPRSASKEQTPPARTTHSAPPVAEAVAPPPNDHCEICHLPLSSEPGIDSNIRPHEASLAHQVCLNHSHPPSHLDRTRTGLRYLSTYGWNPDSRLGLGASGREGIREPLKGRIKNDKAGLGSGLDKDGDRLPAPLPPPKKIQKLNAKQARKGADEARKRGDKLRNMFFQNDEVLKYLGENA
ncbi:hypothetical protein N7448_003633 [Penicillium atrosanguineum]|uniref:Uncharacterized protein n=1 Tax=Penicillium atrosanguineum TaxID=1132637 RepID=A0A9W9PXY4_9EURO|nr:hypothetical protein N7448_003633 [Penicillium atrosanguineum]KAJ5315658.1 hypothetical protein N7476_005965 [Penicillium atrosanguineum]